MRWIFAILILVGCDSGPTFLRDCFATVFSKDVFAEPWQHVAFIEGSPPGAPPIIARLQTPEQTLEWTIEEEAMRGSRDDDRSLLIPIRFHYEPSTRPDLCNDETVPWQDRRWFRVDWEHASLPIPTGLFNDGHKVRHWERAYVNGSEPPMFAAAFASGRLVEFSLLREYALRYTDPGPCWDWYDDEPIDCPVETLLYEVRHRFRR